jgi:Asp-tRNA(Asn)/Glu-tRNA(Gln) amidotransferase C subunit
MALTLEQMRHTAKLARLEYQSRVQSSLFAPLL